MVTGLSLFFLCVLINKLWFLSVSSHFVFVNVTLWGLLDKDTSSHFQKFEKMILPAKLTFSTHCFSTTVTCFKNDSSFFTIERTWSLNSWVAHLSSVDCRASQRAFGNAVPCLDIKTLLHYRICIYFLHCFISGNIVSWAATSINQSNFICIAHIHKPQFVS